MESSDRALQASSGNLGESLQPSAGIAKRSRSLLQQKLIQVDVESPVADEFFRPTERSERKSQAARRVSSELSTTYRCEYNSPRYVEYRQKQKKQKNPKGREQIWPDHVEEAFHDGTFELCFLSHTSRWLMCC